MNKKLKHIITSALLLMGVAATAQVQVGGSVFGGGNLAAVDGNSTVLINQAGSQVGTDVYGGGALAEVGTNTSNNTTVTLTNGTVEGDVYGGGLGDNTTPAMVNGNVVVVVDGGSVSGNVFGCNNVNGTPLGTVTVTINGTDTPGSGFAIGGVYGGGNLAHYDPTTPSTYPTVTINGCTTSVKDVFGGGNAAAVPYTNVTINGGNIDRVFAGGNGESGTPAHVGWKNKEDDPTSTSDNYGAGTALATIHGGTINQVFSGSNANGVIRETMGVTVDKEGSCAIAIGDLYGGGNEAPSQPGAISVGCMDNTDMINNLYGGANQAAITGDIELNIETGRFGNIFGGNNSSGSISGTITVNINKDDDADCASNWYVGNVYGGGNLASYTGSPEVNILNGLVTNNVYGGGLGSSATVTGNPVVHVNGGSVGQDVFGGGSEAAVEGATHVTVTTGTVGQDVYGGGALANTGATTVDILGGTITRDVYGGGLGDGSHSPKENGVVTVNIGAAAGATSGSLALEEHSGSATIGGNVYGCNNSAGSPQDDVTVNIYGTAHTTGVNTIDDAGYALANVFGGGNAANYAPEDGLVSTTKKATVNIFGCQNTIERVFGGGNAAATASVVTDIQGGHISTVFGGGNGELGPSYAANVNGTVNLNIHGGNVGEFYGGSNQNGTISGQITTAVDNNGPCESLNITEFFCGGNFVDITNDLTTTIDCSESSITYLYGGCNQANITGNVTLNVYGGTYDYVFGGSKGRLAHPNVIHPEYTDPTHPEALSANITGNVTLNLYGGTITNVFGGSNVLGNITGTVTVNVLDAESDACPLNITNIYGGSNLTNYSPTDPSLVSPVVNVGHIKNGVSGNVYGGSKGETGTVTTVRANPKVNIGYVSSTMSSYLPLDSNDNPIVPNPPTATIAGSVFGGGDAAQVEGNTEIHLNKHSKVLGNVYGGGNMGEVQGNTKVIVNGKLE